MVSHGRSRSLEQHAILEWAVLASGSNTLAGQRWPFSIKKICLADVLRFFINQNGILVQKLGGISYRRIPAKTGYIYVSFSGWLYVFMCPLYAPFMPFALSASIVSIPNSCIPIPAIITSIQVSNSFEFPTFSICRSNDCFSI